MPWYSASIKAGILLNSVVQKHFGTNSHWPKGKVNLNKNKKEMTIRTIVYTFFAATTLAACSDDNNEETTLNMQKVCFADPTVDILTRSSDDISADNIKQEKVKVWGQCLGATLHTGDTYGIGQYEGNLIETPFREGEIITHNGEAWQGTKTYYYPRDTYYFRFNAFAPADALPNAEGTTGIKDLSVFCNPKTMSFTGDGGTIATYGITGIPVVQEINTSTRAYDLLVPSRFLSAPKTDGTDRNPISFQFKHILSRLSIYTYTSHPTYNFEVKVKSIHLYLPDNVQFKAMYDGCSTNPGPQAATTTASGTVTPNSDKWGWAVASGSANGFVSVATLPRLDITVEEDLNPTYKEYTVISSTEGETVQYHSDASAAQSANLAPTGNEYLLAPTPTFSVNNQQKPHFYHYYLKIKFEVTKKDESTTKAITKLLDLSNYNMDRIVQGTSHKLYINLISQEWAD